MKAEMEKQGKTVELSYLDLLDGLRKDIESDVCMPKGERKKAEKLVGQLADILGPYSA